MLPKIPESIVHTISKKNLKFLDSTFFGGGKIDKEGGEILPKVSSKL